jgi:hypothetical protein
MMISAQNPRQEREVHVNKKTRVSYKKRRLAISSGYVSKMSSTARYNPEVNKQLAVPTTVTQVNNRVKCDQEQVGRQGTDRDKKADNDR